MDETTKEKKRNKKQQKFCNSIGTLTNDPFIVLLEQKKSPASPTILYVKRNKCEDYRILKIGFLQSNAQRETTVHFLWSSFKWERDGGYADSLRREWNCKCENEA